jgi:dipeptidyl aminopeptidase/acylaminoacyl peptidase
MGVCSRFVAAFVSAITLCSAPSALAQAPPPVEAYTRGAGVVGISLSEDGSRIAVTTLRQSTEGDQAGLQIIDLQDNRVVRAFAAPEGRLLGGAFWIDNRRLIFSAWASIRASDNPGSWNQWRGFALFDADTGEQNVAEVFGSSIYWLPGDPLSVRTIGSEYERNLMRSAQGAVDRGVLRIDLDQGGIRRVANLNNAQDEYTSALLFEDDGDLLARVDTDNRTNTWRFLVNGPDGLRTALEGVDETGAPPDLAGILADGRWALVTRRSDEDRWQMLAYDRNSGQFEVIASHDRYDMERGIRDRWTNRVVGVSWTEDLPRQRFFDPALQAAYEHLERVFEDGYAVIQSWSRDRGRIVVRGETSVDAGTYYLFDASTRTLQVLRRSYPELSGGAALGNRQTITYRARDGTRIPAYLTLPANADRNLPLVVLPHGGPHARDDFGFDAQASFLASRGYAVFQPNFRGSTGYGYAWFNAGRRHWGDGMMQTDVEDGVDALIRGEIADPARMCIVGGSYGGYVALTAVTRTPDRYRCAVSVAGVSDLVNMADTNRSDWWRLSMGDRRGDRDHLREISPANFADRVRAPVLLMHGKEDRTVPIWQSQLMRDRLLAAGRDVRFIEFEHEFHGFQYEENQAREFREIESFLAQHIGSGAPPAR